MKDSIIDKLKLGDEKAFENIYNQYYALLCRFACRLLGDSLLAEEIVDDVIFYLWEHRTEFDISSSLRAYLLRAVRNRCLNELHTCANVSEVSFSSLAIPEGLLERMMTDEQHPLGELLERELDTKLLECIHRMSKECREVFKKSRFEQKKYSEIAAELNISINTVKYHIKNALSFINASIGDYLKLLVLFFLTSH